jgi:hypothetical protein
MKLAKVISRSEALIQWMDKAIDGLDVKTSDRVRLSAACLDLAHEHQKSIVLLVANRLYGSAFALVRLVFEAYARGVWLHRCASEAELADFRNGKLNRKFHELLQAIEKIDGFESGVLSAAKQKSWSAMNDFTHGGYIHATRRNTDTTIEPNYSEDEILEAVGFANAIGLLSAIEVALMAGNEAVANSLLEKAKEFWDAGP